MRIHKDIDPSILAPLTSEPILAKESLLDSPEKVAAMGTIATAVAVTSAKETTRAAIEQDSLPKAAMPFIERS